MTVKRLDKVGIVVEDRDAAIAFFTEPGLELSALLYPWPGRHPHRAAEELG